MIEKIHDQMEKKEYYQTEDIRWMSYKKGWKGKNTVITSVV